MADMPDFVARFDAWWSDPVPARLGELLAPDVVLRQPLLPTTRGLEAAIASFAGLLDAIPDLRATVHEWCEDERRVLIEFTLHGSGNGRRISWRAVDRFTLDGRLAAERVSFFDPLPLLGQTLHPALWPTLGRLARARLGR